MKIILQWTEGREVRQTETELPALSWLDTQEHIRQLVKKACKYNDSFPIPEGLRKDGEAL